MHRRTEVAAAAHQQQLLPWHGITKKMQQCQHMPNPRPSERS